MFVRLSANYFFYFALLGLVSPYLSIFLDGNGFNSRQVGEILAILTATKIIAPSLWSILADRSSKPLKVIQFGALLTLICFSGLFWLKSYWQVSLTLALFTLFWTAILPQIEAHTLRTIRDCTKIYGRIRLWGSIGFIALAILAGEVISAFDSLLGVSYFVWIGFIISLCLYLSTLYLTPIKSTGNNRETAPLLDKVLNAKFISFFVAGILLQLSFAPYYGFFALFLRDLGYSGLSTGLFISLGVVAEIFAFIYMGKIFKYFSMNTLLIISLVISSVRWLLTPLIADSAVLLILVQLTHAVSFAVYHSASMAFIAKHFNKNQQSRGQGLYLGGVYGIGGAIGAYITGVLWLDGTGAHHAFFVASFCALLGAIVMISNKSSSQ